MQYENTQLGHFIARPNRFVAHVSIGGKTEVCHVKNTSRLTELLLPGVVVSVQKAANPARKTPYDLIAVRHAGQWVNIDSQAPNAVLGEWLATSGYFGEVTLLQPERTFGHSRFDFYMETPTRKLFVEAKGVTLVENDVARFPGAPTVRGVKHLQELMACLSCGYEGVLAFIVKRNDVEACGPNDELDPAFGQAIREAVGQGVQVLGLGCAVTQNSLAINRFVDVHL